MWDWDGREENARKWMTGAEVVESEGALHDPMRSMMFWPLLAGFLRDQGVGEEDRSEIMKRFVLAKQAEYWAGFYRGWNARKATEG